MICLDPDRRAIILRRTSTTNSLEPTDTAKSIHFNLAYLENESDQRKRLSILAQHGLILDQQPPAMTSPTAPKRHPLKIRKGRKARTLNDTQVNRWLRIQTATNDQMCMSESGDSRTVSSNDD
jgi:hypothetical protein